MYYGTTAVIDGKVYYGGGSTADDNDKRVVYYYDPSQDAWTSLPSKLPVQCFGLGQVVGELVAVGGLTTYYKVTNDVYRFDERSRQWKQTANPMPTARWLPSVLSLQSALVVAGGNTSPCDSVYTAAVEIFKPDTSEWHRTDPLPAACRSVSLVAINNTCYALGGFCDNGYLYSGSSLNQALYASIDDLLGNTVPANQISHSSGSGDTLSAWKTLPNTPSYEPVAAVLPGILLAVGGKETYEEGDDMIMKEVYSYSPSTNSWIHFSDLPAPRSGVAVAVMSSKEILVIGGFHDGDGRVNTVYKGTLR